ncbi:hypothetical protein [Streptomyces sp. NPDC048200]|uniref:hypothetical protein n=1 Tax=Streptomyces sp. NPDC048200 TaxID=3365512 RepID=UPI00371E641D
MAESRQPPRAARAIARTGVIPPALAGFLLLLALAFWTSYAVGSAAGPVAPGLHGTRTGSGTDDGTGGGGDDGDGGMENMPGTTHGHGG